MSHTFYPRSLPHDNFLVMAGGCVEQKIDALKGLAVHEMSYRQW